VKRLALDAAPVASVGAIPDVDTTTRRRQARREAHDLGEAGDLGAGEASRLGARQDVSA
jgi:hypothetical protein